jgi:iron complex outermembrane receptor protein
MATPAVAQQGAVTGTVSSPAGPIARAQVDLISGDSLRARVIAGDAGTYRVQVDPGLYTVSVRALGFSRQRFDSVRIAAGGSVTVDAMLVPLALRLDAMVITPHTRAVSALDAPVSIGVVDEQQIRERTVSTPLEYVTGVAGVDVAQQGVENRQVVARGFNQTFNTTLLVMTDYRSASIPSLRGNLAQYLTPVPDDIERIEVLRGPSSALYGPNATDGVVHFITRSPFDSPGTAISLTGGGRDLVQGTLRQAAVLNARAAYKVSANYFRAREWIAPPDPTEVTERDPITERWNGEARFDYNLAPGRTAVLTVGSTLDRRHVEYFSIGTSQVRNWRYDFGQLRFTDGRFFAQAYYNRSRAGRTFSLNTLNQVVDFSNFLVGQARHGFGLGTNTTVTYGADVQRTDPRTDGTINGRNEDDDRALQAGIFAESETRLTPNVSVFTAARLDHHDRMDGLVLSPRVAVQFTPVEGQRLRLKYDRAFSTPSQTDLFVDLEAARLDPLPYSLRAVGVPRDGLRFDRSCGGPCLASPFAPGGTFGVDVATLWPAIVQIMQAGGVDLSALPAPSSQDVGTLLRLLDTGTGTFNALVGGVRDFPALVPTITNSLEAGWKGSAGGRVVFDLSVYGTRRENFRGPLATATPNAFLSTADLTAYLAQFMPAQDAAGLAAVIGGVDGDPALTGIPLATVTPTGLYAGSDILLSYRNFGSASFWGSDLALEVLATPRVTVSGSWSFVSRNWFPAEEPGDPDLSMNVPRQKVAMGARFRDPYRDFTAELRGRHSQAFDMLDGVWAGRVDAFTAVDAEVGFALPGRPNSRLTISAQNVFDDRHAEFVGAPVIGRMLLTRINHTF